MFIDNVYRKQVTERKIMHYLNKLTNRESRVAWPQGSPDLNSI